MKKSIKEWRPPNRPNLSELKQLVQQGWKFEAGYLYDNKRNKVVTDKALIRRILLTKDLLEYSPVMVYFKMVCEN